MFKSSEIAIPVVALALAALATVYGLFHVTIGGVAVVALVAVAGVYLGIMLGRRSKTANLYADRLQAEIDEIKGRTEFARRELKNRFGLD